MEKTTYSAETVGTVVGGLTGVKAGPSIAEGVLSYLWEHEVRIGGVAESIVYCSVFACSLAVCTITGKAYGSLIDSMIAEERRNK